MKVRLEAPVISKASILYALSILSNFSYLKEIERPNLDRFEENVDASTDHLNSIRNQSPPCSSEELNYATGTANSGKSVNRDVSFGAARELVTASLVFA